VPDTVTSVSTAPLKSVRRNSDPYTCMPLNCAWAKLEA